MNGNTLGRYGHSFGNIDLHDLILKDPSRLKLGGEKRRMSVLFSDIRGFTSIAESMPPEKLVVTINAYLTHMTGIVFEQDGVLDKYIGDAVMAFWNAPLDQADHALRAVKTALAMQTAVADMNREKELPDGLAIRIGIGINTGDMIVGNMGSEARFDYTVIGDNVNLASRLEGLTKEYGVGILVTEATIADIKDKVLARRIDRLRGPRHRRTGLARGTETRRRLRSGARRLLQEGLRRRDSDMRGDPRRAAGRRTMRHAYRTVEAHEGARAGPGLERRLGDAH